MTVLEDLLLEASSGLPTPRPPHQHATPIPALIRRIDKLEAKQANEYKKNKGRIYKLLNSGIVPDPALLTPQQLAPPPAPPTQMDEPSEHVDDDIIIDPVKLHVTLPAEPELQEEKGISHVEHLQHIGIVSLFI